MAQIKLHLVNQTKFDVIFDYKSREYFVPFEFDKTIEVESGSLIYVFPEDKPDDFQHTNRTLETDAEVICRYYYNQLSVTMREI